MKTSALALAVFLCDTFTLAAQVLAQANGVIGSYSPSVRGRDIDTHHLDQRAKPEIGIEKQADAKRPRNNGSVSPVSGQLRTSSLSSSLSQQGRGKVQHCSAERSKFVKMTTSARAKQQEAAMPQHETKTFAALKEGKMRNGSHSKQDTTSQRSNIGFYHTGKAVQLGRKKLCRRGDASPDPACSSSPIKENEAEIVPLLSPESPRSKRYRLQMEAARRQRLDPTTTPLYAPAFQKMAREQYNPVKPDLLPTYAAAGGSVSALGGVVPMINWCAVGGCVGKASCIATVGCAMGSSFFTTGLASAGVGLYSASTKAMKDRQTDKLEKEKNEAREVSLAYIKGLTGIYRGRYANYKEGDPRREWFAKGLEQQFRSPDGIVTELGRHDGDMVWTFIKKMEQNERKNKESKKTEQQERGESTSGTSSQVMTGASSSRATFEVEKGTRASSKLTQPSA